MDIGAVSRNGINDDGDMNAATISGAFPITFPEDVLNYIMIFLLLVLISFYDLLKDRHI